MRIDICLTVSSSLQLWFLLLCLLLFFLFWFPHFVSSLQPTVMTRHLYTGFSIHVLFVFILTGHFPLLGSGILSRETSDACRICLFFLVTCKITCPLSGLFHHKLFILYFSSSVFSSSGYHFIPVGHQLTLWDSLPC